MPRRIYKIVCKNDPKKEIVLNSMFPEDAMEEALTELGWTFQVEWDEPYNSMYQDEHMISLLIKNRQNNKEINQ